MQSLLLIETNVQSHKSVFLLVPKAFSVQYAQVFTAPTFAVLSMIPMHM